MPQFRGRDLDAVRKSGARPRFMKVVAGAVFAIYAPGKRRPRRSGVPKGS